MTVKVRVDDGQTDHGLYSAEGDQVFTELMWISRGKWYTVSEVTLTHNPEYPTPAISVIQPQPGIRFNVYNLDGELVYSNKKKAQADDKSE